MPILILVAAAAPATVASAQTAARPLASAKADVDGDGKVDEVRVEGGQIVVARAGSKKAAWKAFATPGTMTAAELTVGGPGRPYVAVSARFEVDGKPVHEGLVVRWVKGALAEVWRGDVGPVGRDGDYEVRIDATASGLVRSQRRVGVVRCDGKPAALFAEGWDDAGGKFRPIRGSVDVDEAAPVVTATRAAPANPAAVSAVFRASVTSTEAGAAGGAAAGAPARAPAAAAVAALPAPRGARPPRLSSSSRIVLQSSTHSLQM